MLTKILANWIQQYIKKIIHHDQVELISGMERWSIVCKSINVIHKIQHYIKKIMHHDQVELTSGMERWSNICKSISVIHHIEQWRIKLMIVTIDTEKAIEKLQHLFVMKIPQQSKYRRSIPQHNKGHICQAHS